MSATDGNDDRNVIIAVNRDVAVERDRVTGTHLRTKVVVVGAGISGVTAAAKLIQNGIKDVVVLEAQDYIGGRIKAQVVGDKTIDMGAMFIHGQVGNPIYQIVHRLGMVDDKTREIPTFFYTSKGEKGPFQEVEDLIAVLKDKKGAIPAEVGQSMREVIVNLYNQFLQKNQVCADHPKRELLEAALRWSLFYDCIWESCSDMSEVSAWSNFNYVNFEGNQHTFIKGGYSTLMRSLLNLIPGDVIRTGMPVSSIDWTNPKDGGISVGCSNGDVFTTDHVIMTISLGCLKAGHDSMFSPSLPSSFLNSIERLELGSLGKIFVQWETPFWNKEMGVMYRFLHLETEQHPLTLKHDRSKQKTCFGKPWWFEINGCHSSTDKDNFLLFWFLEHQMEAIRDVDDHEVLAVLQELMQVYIKDTVIPMPSAMYRTDWRHNPYVRGTYTYCIPSIDSSDVEHLNRPVFPSKQNPRLLFAGESFASEYMATTHGAFMTGEGQAEIVLKANGIKEFARVVDVISYES